MTRALRSVPNGDDILFTADQLAAALGSSVEGGEGNRIEITGVSVDSRATEPGDAFFALAGETTDGHDFLARAEEAGAVVALVRSDFAAGNHPSLPLIPVGDTLIALGEAASWHRSRFDVACVAITGSVGKTTTKDMVSAVLAERGEILRNPGNFNTEIGTPLTLLSLGSRHAGLVQEIGMRKPGDVRYLAEMIRPDVGILTNVRESHLEFFGTVEHLAQSKAELFQNLPSSGWAIVNGDDDFAQYMLDAGCARAILYYPSGVRKDCATFQVWAEDVCLDDRARAQFTLHRSDGVKLPIRLEIAGEHHVANALAAAAAGTAIGISPEGIARGLRGFEPTEMRSEWIRCGGFTILNDAYNSSPTSCKAALDMLSSIATEGRRVAVLGPMLELGPVEESGHRDVGRAVAVSATDLLFTALSPADLIGSAALECGFPAGAYRHFDQMDELCRALSASVRDGDVILIKASRSCRFERCVDAILSGMRREGGEV
ncbi:MAG: UDP-N-acetylmuramoyl-tripeptide--D-alanyl-D-alanine ligase [Bacillota bacterium]